MDPVFGAVYGTICIFCFEYQKYNSTASAFDYIRVLWHSAIDNCTIVCYDFLYGKTNH